MQTTEKEMDAIRQAWRIQRLNNAKLSAFLRDGERNSPSNEMKTPEEEPESTAMMKYLLSSLSPFPSRSLPKGRDLKVFGKAVSLLTEAVEEDVLTESEALAMIEFLAARFVSRRLGSIMENVFDTSSPQRYTFRHMRGVLK